MAFDKTNQLQSVRGLYARQMLALANASHNQALENAFASIPREGFLGDDKWVIAPDASGYIPLPENDPALIYQDVVVGLATHRGVNNGSPSLHAKWMHAMAPQRGDTVVHIGAGAGYYSAILSELVGPSGRVIAIEYDETMAARTAKNLAYASNVDVICADGAKHDFPPADCIYVNFGVGRPVDTWIDNLKPGGRLLLPLGAPTLRPNFPGRFTGEAIALLVTRTGEHYAASSLGSVWFIFAEGVLAACGQDADALRDSLKNENDDRIRSLIWKQPAKEPGWFTGEDWALSFEDVLVH